MVKGWRLLVLAAVTFTVLFSPLVSAQNYEKDKMAETLFQFALNLYYKGSLDLAAEEFRKIIENYPESAYADNALFWLSKYYQTQENYELAAKNLIRIIDQYPQADQAPAAYYELGTLLSNPKNPSYNLDKARVYYLKMVALYPESPLTDTSLLGVARVSFLLEDYATVIEEARKVLRRHPEDRLGAEAQWLVARSYQRLGYGLQALKECQALQNQFPEEGLAVSAKNMATQIYRYLIIKPYEPTETVEWQPARGKPLNILQLKIDTQGNMLLLDRQQGAWRYTPKSKALTAIGGKGTLPQPLEEPTALTFDEDNNVYLVDASNATLYKFSAAGKLMNVFPVRNLAKESPKSISALAVSPMGIIWMADPKEGKVWVLDEKGKFLGVLGAGVDKEEDLERPVDLALDRRGNLWVLDRGTKRLYKFDAQKKLVGKAGKGILTKEGKEIVFDDPFKLALDDLGHAYVLDAGSVFGKGGIRIIRLDNKMNLVQEILNPQGDARELKDPTALALDHQGSLWVADADKKGAVVFQ